MFSTYDIPSTLSPLPPKVLLVPWGCQLSGRAQSWGNAYTLRPLPHLHGKQMCLMFGIVTILQYNAAVLLRHESVVFKNLSSFLKLPFCFNMPLFSIFQVDVFLLQQSFGMSWNLLAKTYIHNFFFFGHACSMWNFLGQGSNLSHSSDNAKSSTARLPGNS